LIKGKITYYQNNIFSVIIIKIIKEFELWFNKNKNLDKNLNKNINEC